MFRVVSSIALTSYPLFTNAALAFKKDLVPANQWLGSIIGLCLVGFLFAILYPHAKKRGLINKSQKHLLKTIPIQNKIKAYVIEYEGKHFLIADNQNALAIHEFKKGESNEH